MIGICIGFLAFLACAARASLFIRSIGTARPLPITSWTDSEYLLVLIPECLYQIATSETGDFRAGLGRKSLAE